MKRPFIDELFASIDLAREQVVLASGAVKVKLVQLERSYSVLTDHLGDLEANQVLSYSEVKAALEQCLDYIVNPFSVVKKNDFIAYLCYCHLALRRAEEAIDSRYGELGL
ncbi:hypothetical protein [Thaumasiovibrio subtropicus]|uniref:hypothetical protein n=1 Tax=Thaumasiovibrio subtropicus TaxID=1891207 RepID=UPI000B360FB7|nr:hypothetical protein [Thaumasiovibrio subtropicus]